MRVVDSHTLNAAKAKTYHDISHARSEIDQISWISGDRIDPRKYYQPGRYYDDCTRWTIQAGAPAQGYRVRISSVMVYSVKVGAETRTYAINSATFRVKMV